MLANAPTCLVTGAAGFIGSTLSEFLLDRDFTVIGVDSFTPTYPRARKEENLRTLRAHPRFCFVEGDLCTMDLAALLREHSVRCVLHQAGQASVRPSWGAHFDDYVQRNIVATQKLLEAAKEYPLERLVFASSSSVYGDAETLPTTEDILPRPLSPYGVTKLAAEHLAMLYARQFGVPAVALRYFSVYGPRQRPDMAFALFIEALLNGRPISILGDGLQSRDFTFAEDIAQANLLALRAGPEVAGRVYNVGGGSRTTLNAALELLQECVGARAQVTYRQAAAGDQRHTSADTTRARAELGYVPRISLEEGLRRQVAWAKAVPRTES